MCFKQLVNRSRKRALRRCGVMWERKVTLFTPPDEDIAMLIRSIDLDNATPEEMRRFIQLLKDKLDKNV